MRIVIAPDSFKGSMSALTAAHAIAAGIRDVLPNAEIAIAPLADGGEGTVDALVAAVPGSMVATCDVHGPLGLPVTARYGLLGPGGKTAVVEMAAASGLTLVSPQDRDIMRSSTFGTGELIRAACQQPSVARLIIGLGGSATNDGGAGALCALGVRFYDAKGNTPMEQISPRSLPSIQYADAASAFDISAEIAIATDVTNPLVGPNGASAVFGPQKGATAEMAAELDGILRDYAPILDRIASQRGADWLDGKTWTASRPGGGAAGGLGAALMALYPSARLMPGIDLVLDTANFDALIAMADLVITGEGKLDRQTLLGKTICGVLRRTMPRNVRTIALAGSVDADAATALRSLGLESAHALLGLANGVDDAIARAPKLLRDLARRLVGDFT